MKRFLLVIAIVFCASTLSAQTKTAYCDVYLRGGGLSLNATIAFDGEAYDYNYRVNIGEVINELAAYGWVLDREIVIPRHPLFALFTRHKLHLIMKKEYQEGEDPFRNFRPYNTLTHKTETYSHQDSSATGLATVAGNSISVGQKVEFNGTNAIIVHVADTQVVLAANGTEGTWDKAMAYCETLGEEWRLPSSAEIHMIKNCLESNCYWTIEELNEKRAKYYNSSFYESYNGNKSLKNYILPIAIVDISELEQKETL